MKDGAVLANAGHFDVEISLPDLRAAAVDVREVLPLVERYDLGDRRAEPARAAAGSSTWRRPRAIRPRSWTCRFAFQALAAEAPRRAARWTPGVHPVPDAIEREVAALKLARARRRDRRADARADRLPVAHIATARPLTRISGALGRCRSSARLAGPCPRPAGRSPGRRRQPAQGAQVAPERRGGRAGGRVFDDAADRERITGVERSGCGLAADQLHGGPGRARAWGCRAGRSRSRGRRAVPRGGGEDQMAAPANPTRGGSAGSRSSRASRGRPAPRRAVRSGAGLDVRAGTLVSVARRARRRVAPTGTGSGRACRTAAGRSDAVGEGDGGGDGGVPAERHLRQRGEVADVVGPVSPWVRNAVSE